MQKNNYKIHFISGGLAGRSFVVPPDGLLIGKSRAAAIRPGDKDIGGEHAALRIQGDRVILTSMAETVFVREEQLAPGAECSIGPGTDVRLGKNLVFLLQTDEEVPEDGMDDGEEETQDEATMDDLGGAAAEDAAPEAQTRYASATELKDLRTFAQSRIRRRRIVLSVSVLLFLVIVVGGFLYTEFSDENPVTWPGELTGQYLDDEVRFELPPAGKFLIYFPKCKWTTIRKNADGTDCDVMTLLGRKLDVPFHLRLKVNTIPNGYIVPKDKSFEQWKKLAVERQGIVFTSLPERKFYSPETSGYPYYAVSYKRGDKDSQWQGIVSYLRYHDREIIFLREVPLRHFWRAEGVLEAFNCFVASSDARLSYWEIPEKVSLEKSKTSIYKGLLEIMWGHLITNNWEDVKSQFAELLSVSYHQNDLGMARDALVLWQEFRKRQQFWYCQECLAYQKCRLNRDMGGMIRIRNECLRKFPDAGDCRHERIIKNIWDVEL
ncbi:MAG: FHA domain-containing protein [Lentisphaeria bacterium]|nr:FHA domain-containing protein [Lentisphaeria bacterium]